LLLFFRKIRSIATIAMPFRDFRQIFTLSGCFLVAVLPLGAQEARQQYEMLCGACHGANGKGAGEGSFPPLAGSEWIQGDAGRMIQIILHGLEGPVTVKD
jgi:hypothetical protein